MFYDVFNSLCTSKGISCKRATLEMGLSNSIATKWKKTGAIPNGETLNLIAEYFGVSVDYLLGAETKNAPTPEDERIDFDDFTYAMQNEARDLTDVDKQLLLSMAKQLNDARKQRNGEHK